MYIIYTHYHYYHYYSYYHYDYLGVCHLGQQVVDGHDEELLDVPRLIYICVCIYIYIYTYTII